MDSARCIAHPNITRLLGIVWLDGAPQLASEYVDGVSLHELTRTFAGQATPIEPRVAARIDLRRAVCRGEREGPLAWGRRGLLRPLPVRGHDLDRRVRRDAVDGSRRRDVAQPRERALLRGPALENLASSTLAMSDVRAAGLELLTLLTNHEPDSQAQQRLASAPLRSPQS